MSTCWPATWPGQSGRSSTIVTACGVSWTTSATMATRHVTACGASRALTARGAPAGGSGPRARGRVRRRPPRAGPPPASRAASPAARPGRTPGARGGGAPPRRRSRSRPRARRRPTASRSAPASPRRLRVVILPFEAAVAEAATGDIWLFRGRSLADRAIQAVTNSPVNHVGMVVALDDLPPLLWHAELGRSLPDVWTGQRRRGVQLHVLRDAVTTWSA